MSCQQKEIQLEILETKELKGIPGASGISCAQGFCYVIGDNSPFLFQLDSDYETISRTPIYSLENLEGEEIIKRLKPDFEALELIRGNELLIFGSGSKSPERDILVRIPLKASGEAGEITTYDLSDFYSEIRKMDVLRNAELNLEALAFHREELYLFNRGRNVIFVFALDALMRHLESDEAFPEMRILQPELPEKNGLQSGFSGATIDEHENLIFTTSVEDTDNAYDDGEVLGSFIGLIPLSRLEDKTAYRYVEIGGSSMPLKVESVAVQEKLSANEAILLLTTDSDGDQSLLIKSRLSW